VTRRERIVFLLEHLHDCCGPSSSATHSGGLGDGPGFVLTSTMAEHPSVVELVRCLELMRRTVPRHAAAVVEWYACQWYVDHVPVTAKRRGRLVRLRDSDGRLATKPVRVPARPAWLRRQPLDRQTGEPRMVSRGVDMLAGLYRGDPFIPQQLLDAA
jgi:hypothetical protein